MRVPRFHELVGRNEFILGQLSAGLLWFHVWFLHSLGCELCKIVVNFYHFNQSIIILKLPSISCFLAAVSLLALSLYEKRFFETPKKAMQIFEVLIYSGTLIPTILYKNNERLEGEVPKQKEEAEWKNRGQISRVGEPRTRPPRVFTKRKYRYARSQKLTEESKLISLSFIPRLSKLAFVGR